MNPKLRLPRRSRFDRFFPALLLGSVAACLALSPARAEPRQDRHVILVSIDGLAHYYFDDPKAHMPTIRALAAKGARAKRMEASFPTVTWPNHTTLVTGVHAGRHGVIGNNYYDRALGKVVPLIPDPLFDKAEIVKSPTIYDFLHGAGLKTAGVCWPASRNAATLDWQVPDVFDQKIFEDASTPSLLAELKERGIPYWKQNEWCKLGNAGKPQRDWMYTRIAQHLIGTHRPNFLALHLVSVDALEHATGRQSEEAYWAVTDSDRCIRELVDTVEAAGLGDSTTFFITADHGFITYTKEIAANVVLRGEGLREGQGLKLRQQAFALGQGGGCFIYILDDANRDAIRDRLAARFREVEGVEVVIEPGDFAKFGHKLPSENPHEPDLMLGAADGYSFSGKDDGDAFVILTDGPRGSHGYSPFHDLMGAAFVASGAGIKPGAVIDAMSNTDVAPTIGAVLGVSMENTEGRVLTEILAE
ncbi:MAG: alkaline phosphatase family protein [Verrucomicrobiae bacterium]|nr:alkaline phosphatase family protein [Verrucomicrobiae bacterium]MCP5541797.1 alkaline phosphatase family protein [Akkermansiaceae bacterium]